MTLTCINSSNSAIATLRNDNQCTLRRTSKIETSLHQQWTKNYLKQGIADSAGSGDMH